MASSSLTFRTLPSRPIKPTTESPIAFGLLGDLVANTPWGVESQGVRTRGEYPTDLWNQYSTMTCEKPSMSFSPSAYSSKTSIAHVCSDSHP